MTMVKLAGRWFPGIDHPHFKIQSLACEWMVCIDGDSVPLDFCDRDKLFTCAAVNANPIPTCTSSTALNCVFGISIVFS